MKKGLIFFLVFAMLITAILYGVQNTQSIVQQDGSKAVVNIQNKEETNLNTFIKDYQENQFEKIDIVDNTRLEGYKFKGETDSKANLFLNQDVKQKNYDVIYAFKPSDTSINELGLFLTGTVPLNVKFTEKSVVSRIFLEQILPLLFLVIIFVVLLKVFGPKGGGFPFGTQAGKLRTKAEVKTTFKDVAGIEESKQELLEVVDYLKNPGKYKKVGARIPKGVLLYGPPGSGKTLLARAVAGEAGVAFFSASGSEFMEMLVGMGAAKVRELFNKAKATSPSIIFIDEIDSIGKKRGGGYTGGHQEQEQTLNQILTEMDGFDKDTNIIVIASTNRPDTLDPALLRAGRFDRKVYVGKPNVEERMEIIKLHTKDKQIDKATDLDMLARRTSGFVGADLENVINEAAIKVAKEGRMTLTNDDFEYALEKVIMGPEKKIKTMKDKDRKTVTYHELGHAVTAYFLPNADPVEKISIVSRGMALGVTWMMPEEDRYLYSKAKFLDELVSLLGGRAAEEVIFGKEEITTGASNDLERATKITTDMIMKYGMDEDLGTIMYLDRDNGEYVPFKPFSEITSQMIDQKTKDILRNAYDKSKQIIRENLDTIEKLAKILLEKEYITKEEFEAVMKDPSAADKIIEEMTQKKLIKEVVTTEVDKDEEKSEDEKVTQKKKLEKVLDKFLKKDKNN